MRIGFFDDYKLGAIRGAAIVDVSSVVADIPHLGPHDLINGLIARYESCRARLEDASARGKAIPLTSVTLRAPLPRPINIDCMAVNYMEDGTRKEPAPINAFHKSPSAIIGPEGTMILPDAPASVFEGEAELGVVIGLPPPNNVFFQMKSRDTFAPIGPYLVTKDEIKDPHKLQVRLWNNGVLRQNFNTSDMAHKIPRCIEWASALHTLEPGDILASGTNHRGLHAFQDGDRIELEIDGLGKLAFSVRDNLGRTWSRETRLERQEKGLDPVAPQLTGKYTPGKD
jgi:2-keto-4-pentenoate hydratase/2-oxohepta-3-ene-1,7-dioic acid hydratase in catechol pathway